MLILSITNKKYLYKLKVQHTNKIAFLYYYFLYYILIFYIIEKFKVRFFYFIRQFFLIIIILCVNLNSIIKKIKILFINLNFIKQS